ncbi:hypothetical protein DXG03_009124 [Asterophora parasitica]|uniref:EthD domain-containing protein n=1 Tax=Asterophora parasitica TaxID=117018 RepID=A0A9P7G7A1_9AGAR|nr:hypothetical protein DXG03_009124 [Asterophora parasitica]
MSTEGRTDRVRLLYFLKRNPKISKEEFAHHWINIATPIYTSLDIVKRNNITAQLTVSNDNVVGAHASGFPSSDWDGVATIEGPSFEKIFESLLSDEYKSLVGIEMPKFLDPSKSQILPLNVIAVAE